MMTWTWSAGWHVQLFTPIPFLCVLQKVKKTSTWLSPLFSFLFFYHFNCDLLALLNIYPFFFFRSNFHFFPVYTYCVLAHAFTGCYAWECQHKAVRWPRCMQSEISFSPKTIHFHFHSSVHVNVRVFHFEAEGRPLPILCPHVGLRRIITEQDALLAHHKFGIRTQVSRNCSFNNTLQVWSSWFVCEKSSHDNNMGICFFWRLTKSLLITMITSI